MHNHWRASIYFYHLADDVHLLMDTQETTTTQNMTRAVLLAYPGDPFLLNYWLHFFDTVWGKEVDALYIGLNSPIEEPVIEYIYNRIEKSRELTGKKIVVHRQPTMADHGPTINKLLDLCTEQLVMMIEDDGFIFKPGHVDWCFKQIESGQYDIVGSKRGSCHMEILTGAKEKWGLDYEGEGDHGPNFWPNFFFTKKEILLRTDRNFAAKAWHKGDTVEGLGITVVDDVIYGDTFVSASLQLRGIIPIERILCIPQYHGSPDDIEHAQQRKYLFDGKAPWTHIGSLSSGVGGVLRDDRNRHLDKRTTAPDGGETFLPREWCKTDAEKNEWERRVQWWDRFYWFAYVDTSTDVIADFRKAYGEAVQQIITQYKLRPENIKERQRIYKDLLGV